MRAAIVALLMLSGSVTAAEAPPPSSIGAATMAADGTIVMRLRADGPAGTIGEGQFTYRRGDPQYDKVLRHLRGLKPGQTKSVPPWND